MPLHSAQASGSPRIVGTIGSAITTQTTTFSGAEEVWLVGTAATATVTLASRTAGARLLILAVLDSVTRTITISDGAGGTQAFTLPATASGATLGIIEARCPNTTDIAAAVGTGSTSGAETDPNAILKSLIDAAGDLIVGSADNTAARLAKGSDGQVLTVVAGSVAWANAASGFSNPMTTSQDIIVGGSSGTAGRLAKGANGTVLTINGSGNVAWVAPTDVGFANPMTTAGDLIVGGASGAAARLAKGTDGQVLKMASGSVAWGTDSTGGGGGSGVDRLNGLAAPCDPRLIDSTIVIGSDVLFGCRVVIPKTGTLRDLYVFMTATSGNFRGAVYDTGQAAANVRTRLYDSGSVAAIALISGLGVWQPIGDPNLAVTAGDQLDLAVECDNNTVSLGRFAPMLSPAQATLPTSFFPSAVTPRLSWRRKLYPVVFADGAPATLSDADVGDIYGDGSPQSAAIFIMARVV